MCVKGILAQAQDLGFVLRLFSGDSGDFRVRGGDGALSTVGPGSSGGFEAHPGTPIAPARGEGVSGKRLNRQHQFYICKL